MRGRATFVADFRQSLLGRLELDPGVLYDFESGREHDDSLLSRYIIPANGCNRRESCSNSFVTSLVRMAGMGENTGTGRIDFPRDPSLLRGNECRVCAAIMDRKFFEAKHAWWRYFPSHFNLPAWVQMKDFDNP